MVDLILGSDHRGYDLKEKISEWLCPLDDEGKFDIAVFQDAGIHQSKRTDYNDVAIKVAESMDVCDKAILICGSGFGMAIQANRYFNVRAVVCNSRFDVQRARQHNNMNVLCIGADSVSFNTAKEMIKDFFDVKFEKGRHTKRVKKLGIKRNV